MWLGEERERGRGEIKVQQWTQPYRDDLKVRGGKNEGKCERNRRAEAPALGAMKLVADKLPCAWEAETGEGGVSGVIHRRGRMERNGVRGGGGGMKKKKRKDDRKSTAEEGKENRDR